MARYTRRPATKASRMLSRMVREYNAAQHKHAHGPGTSTPFCQGCTDKAELISVLALLRVEREAAREAVAS